jgi:hypothetical protein
MFPCPFTLGGRKPMDRTPDGLINQEVRPEDRDLGRTTRHHRLGSEETRLYEPAAGQRGVVGPGPIGDNRAVAADYDGTDAFRGASFTGVCRPGSSFRQCDPIALRWRRMIPATKVRVLRDNGSAAWEPLVVEFVLVDCLTYQGLLASQQRHA